MAEQAIRDHILMREVFHCRPSQLAEEDEADIQLHWSIRQALVNREKKEVQ